jgi:HEPN domain-containing protein
MPPESAEIRAWIEKVRHDLCTAQLALDQSPPITDVAGFHVQQAVEKTLKAFLVWRGVEFEKIHDLRALGLACARGDPAFAGWIERVAPLSAYAVRFRYPGPAEPTPEDVRAALDLALELWQFVTERLPADSVP